MASWNRDGTKRANLPHLHLPTTTHFLLTTGGKSYDSAFGLYHEEVYIDEEYEDYQPDYWCLEDDDLVVVNLKRLRSRAEKTTLPHREVSLIGPPWRKKPEGEWYNAEPGTKLWFTVELPPVSSRPYIIVESRPPRERGQRVRLDSTLKGSLITVEDVFFAARALCADDTRSYDEFHVVEDKEGRLVLAVEIDNWST